MPFFAACASLLQHLTFDTDQNPLVAKSISPGISAIALILSISGCVENVVESPKISGRVTITPKLVYTYVGDPYNIIQVSSSGILPYEAKTTIQLRSSDTSICVLGEGNVVGVKRIGRAFIVASLVDARGKVIAADSAAFFSVTDRVLMASVPELSVKTPAGTIFAASLYSPNLYRSTDDGASWLPQPGLPQTIGAFNISGSQSHNSLLVSLGSPYDGGQLFFSPDNGETWNETPTRPSSLFLQDIQIDPSDPATFLSLHHEIGFYGNKFHIFRSTNSGTSWDTLASLPLIGSYPHLLFIPQTSQETIYLTSVGGGYFTMNGGTSWDPYPVSLPLWPVAMEESGSLYAISENSVYRHKADSNSWELEFSPGAGIQSLGLHGDFSLVLFGTGQLIPGAFSFNSGQSQTVINFPYTQYGYSPLNISSKIQVVMVDGTRAECLMICSGSIFRISLYHP